jgi:hypothetical protein
VLIYFNNKLLQVSSRLAAHHQEDQLCINNNWCRHALCWLDAGKFQSEDTKIYSATLKIICQDILAPRLRETMGRLRTSEDTKPRSRTYWDSSVFSLPVNTLKLNIVTRKEYVEFKKYVYSVYDGWLAYFRALIYFLVNLRFNPGLPFNFYV